jgi:hypothetical protein
MTAIKGIFSQAQWLEQHNCNCSGVSQRTRCAIAGTGIGMHTLCRHRRAAGRSGTPPRILWLRTATSHPCQSRSTATRRCHHLRPCRASAQMKAAGIRRSRTRHRTLKRVRPPPSPMWCVRLVRLMRGPPASAPSTRPASAGAAGETAPRQTREAARPAHARAVSRGSAAARRSGRPSRERAAAAAAAAAQGGQQLQASGSQQAPSQRTIADCPAAAGRWLGSPPRTAPPPAGR